MRLRKNPASSTTRRMLNQDGRAERSSLGKKSISPLTAIQPRLTQRIQRGINRPLGKREKTRKKTIKERAFKNWIGSHHAGAVAPKGPVRLFVPTTPTVTSMMLIQWLDIIYRPCTPINLLSPTFFWYISY